MALFILGGLFIFGFQADISHPYDASGGGNDTTDNYLSLKAHVRKSPKTTNPESKEENIWLDSALITIYLNKIPYSEFWTTKKGKSTFKLSLNKNYLIEISKKGFVSKSFEVNTKVPIGQNEVYSFDFDIDIFEKVNGLDASVLEKPIAKVAYNIVDERFAYDISFTNKINSELKKMYRNYYLLQKEQLDSIAKTKTTIKGKSN
jgi:hypothetical protein